MNSLKNSQRGSVITYILIALFMIGLLTMSLTEGPKKSAISQRLDTLSIALKTDLDSIEATINNCVLVYTNSVDIDEDGDKDVTDNPNAPFPLIYTKAADYALTGALTNAICPGTPPTPLTVLVDDPTNDQTLFGGTSGRGFRILGDPAAYTVTYNTNVTEGVYVEIVPAVADPLWVEAATRLNNNYTECKYATVTDGAACANTCVYFWLKRLDSSTIAPEAPDCSYPLP